MKKRKQPLRIGTRLEGHHMDRLVTKIPTAALIKMAAALADVLKHCGCERCKAIEYAMYMGSITDEA